MPKINVVAGFIPASLVGTMWAGTRPAPTTLNNDKCQSSNDKNRRSGGVYLRLTSGDDVGGYKAHPYDSVRGRGISWQLRIVKEGIPSRLVKIKV